MPRRSIADPGDANLSEQRQDRAGVAALVAQPHPTLRALNDDRITDVPVPACVEMRP
jgi:hypothetical protein